MAELVLRNARLLFNNHDMSGDMNNVGLTYSNDVLDATVFNTSGKKRKVGLVDCDIKASGFFNTAASSNNDTPDPIFQNAVGSSDNGIVSILPHGTALDSVAYMTQVQAASYAPGGNVGEMMAYNFVASGESKPVVRGRLFEAGTLSTALTPNYYGLGVIGSTQKLYLAGHFLNMSSSAAVVTVEVQADETSGFAAPSTMMSFVVDEATNTSVWKSTGFKAGTSSDNNFRVKFIPTTTGDSVTGFINMGIY